MAGPPHPQKKAARTQRDGLKDLQSSSSVLACVSVKQELTWTPESNTCETRRSTL